MSDGSIRGHFSPFFVCSHSHLFVISITLTSSLLLEFQLDLNIVTNQIIKPVRPLDFVQEIKRKCDNTKYNEEIEIT